MKGKKIMYRCDVPRMDGNLERNIHLSIHAAELGFIYKLLEENPSDALILREFAKQVKTITNEILSETYGGLMDK